jgi:predicted dehydrogenase
MHAPAFNPARRRFLKSVALATGGLPLWFLERERALAADGVKPPAANDRPNIGWIGCGGRGTDIVKQAAKFGTVVAFCDADAARAEKAGALFPQARGFKDFREVLARGDVDVIVNGTPDHWHTFVNLGAMKAGKDVYSEKPLTLTIDEGKRLVAESKRTGRILQTGSQQRSDARFRLACELVRNGRLGKLQHVITSLPAGPHGGPFASMQAPDGLNWDYWQGQAPAHDYVKERCHGSFRYWLEYADGTMSDWGAHHNDIALWGIGAERSGPVSVSGVSTVPAIPGGYTAPSQYRVDYTYANGVTHRCQSTTSNGFDGSVKGQAEGEELPHGVKFIGSEGWIFVTRGKIEASRPELLSDPLEKKSVELYVSTNHMGNFFDCVKSRKPPVCDVEIGHRSVSVCHLGVIAMRLGRALRWDPVAERFVGDKEADGCVEREQRSPWTYAML